MLRAVSLDNRRSLREAVLARRRDLPEADCRRCSEQIQATALQLEEYRKANIVALYSPVQNEVDTSVILTDAINSGKRVYYPKLSFAQSCSFAQIRSSAELVGGPYGVLEPAGSERLLPTDSDRVIVFIPGLLFDRRGNRLGRGGGWYDRALEGLVGRGVYVGLAYDFQLVKTLSVKSWDQRVHIIITENNRIDCECDED
jgi:5-formyltetrahydrofolate cyclo-ligase